MSLLPFSSSSSSSLPPTETTNLNNNNKTTVDWKSQTDKVTRFCVRKGFAVKFERCKHGCSTVCFMENEIIIHSRSTPERIFYSLLHELGHILIHENYQHYAQNTGFVPNNFSEQSLTQRVSEVEEEYDAWKLGYKQAKRMRLKIDRIEYEKLKASYLSTYFEWAIDRKISKRIKTAVGTALKKTAASTSAAIAASKKKKKKKKASTSLGNNNSKS